MKGRPIVATNHCGQSSSFFFFFFSAKHATSWKVGQLYMCLLAPSPPRTRTEHFEAGERANHSLSNLWAWLTSCSFGTLVLLDS